MLTWDEINTDQMLSLLHHFGEWLSEIVGWVKWSCEKKKTLRQSAIVLCNACIVINELAPVLHLQVV